MAFEAVQDKEGYYGVCVFEAENASDNELKQAFGKYGIVIKINRSSNLVFIRYETKEEANSCLREMPNNGPYRVKPARSKANHDQSFSPNSSRNSMENSRDSWKNNSGGESQRRSRGDGDNYDSRTRRPPPALVPVIAPCGTKKPVKDVLIGNLPLSMPQGEVYKMCTRTKVMPVHIEMRTIHRPPVPAISYAQVFVRTEAEAKDLVEGLHRLVVNEHQLVVGMKDDLAERGKRLS